LLAASVVMPVAEGLLVAGAEDAPFGLSEISYLDNVLLLIAALVVTFGMCCLIYYFVPKGHVPWHGVWPGALFVTITTGIANAVFPFYLGEISNVDQFGAALGFILVALFWFYLVSLALMAGAVVNALRHELHDTGTIDEQCWE
jgi:uncharacterized BrkB/YihY/UPF0761 family membrane protein